METKKCVKCGMELPVEMFYKTNHGKGIDSCCMQCRKEAMKARRAAKRAKMQEAQKIANEAPINAQTLTLADGTVLKKVEKQRTLADYTSRELLTELKSRGYVWSDMYCRCAVKYADI